MDRASGDAALRRIKMSIASTMAGWTLGLTPLVVLLVNNDARGLKLLYLVALAGAPALDILGLVLAIQARRLGERDHLGCLAAVAIVLAVLGLVGVVPLFFSAIFFLPS
jgi:hypothetical protein